MTDKCEICLLDVSNNSIACDQCDTWYHYHCVNLTISDFQTLKKNKPYPGFAQYVLLTPTVVNAISNSIPILPKIVSAATNANNFSTLNVLN